jgi:hypothetical protein
MNSTTIENQFSLLDCQDLLYFKIVFDIGSKILQYGSILGLTFCIIVFFRIIINSKKEPKSQMFKYFLCKSIFDLLVFVTVIIDIGYYCENCGTTYVWQLWYIWIYYYAYTAFVSISNIMEIAATVDCYLIVENKFQFMMKNKVFNGVLIISIILNIFINVHYIFIFKIVEINNEETNSTTYTVVDSMEYIEASFFPFINYSILIYRELLPLLILIIFNILILLAFKKVSARKKQMQTNSGTVSNATLRIQKAEKNKLKLIFTVSFSYVILRMPFTVYQVPFHGRNFFWDCYYFPASLRLYDFSFFIQVFNYIFFNHKFKRFFLLTIKFQKYNSNDDQHTGFSSTRNTN